MAYIPRKNMFGRDFGLKRGTSPRFYNPNGFESYALYLSTAVGSTAELVDVAHLTKVASVTTGTTTIPARGISSISSSSGVWDLGTPIVGVPKKIVSTTTSTLVRTINSAVNIMISSNPVSTGYPQLALSTGSAITINGQFQELNLVGLTTALWKVASYHGYSTAQAAVA